MIFEVSPRASELHERLTSFMESQAKLKGKVTSTMAYPILMALIGMTLISVLMIAVVPNVTSILKRIVAILKVPLVLIRV